MTCACCLDASGQCVTSSVDTKTCGASPVSNVNGSLSCGDHSLVLTLNPQMVPLGGHALISWNVPDAKSCMVSFGPWNLWAGTQETGDTATYGKATNDITYTLNCDMKDGSKRSGQATMMVPVAVPASFVPPSWRGRHGHAPIRPGSCSGSRRSTGCSDPGR